MDGFPYRISGLQSLSKKFSSSITKYFFTLFEEKFTFTAEQVLRYNSVSASGPVIQLSHLAVVGRCSEL